MKKKKRTTQEIETIINDLTFIFEEACDLYRDALKKRKSNRSEKELLRDNSRGTNIHKFQTKFAWILHDIKCGPRFFIDDNIDEAYDLINHIKTISDLN